MRRPTVDSATRIRRRSRLGRMWRIGELTIWCTRLVISRPSPRLDGHRVREVDVARQHVDRGRWFVITAGGATCQQQLLELAERTVERRPVLGVEGATDLLADPGPDPTPCALADRLAPLLEGVDAARREDRERRHEHQVTARFGRPVDDPAPLVLVDHRRACSSRTRPLRTSIIDELDVPEAAGVAERVAARDRRLTTPTRRPTAAAPSRRRRSRSTRASMASRSISPGERFPRCW